MERTRFVAWVKRTRFVAWVKQNDFNDLYDYTPSLFEPVEKPRPSIENLRGKAPQDIELGDQEPPKQNNRMKGGL